MSVTHTNIPHRPRLTVYAPALLALLYMLPRILDAHFGLLDDAVTLLHARETLADPAVSLYAYAPAGRFLPCYWLYWAFWYLLGGQHPAVYFLGNAALLAATVAALIALMRQWGATAFQTWTAALFFLSSAPVAECYFTLSKGEPVVLLSFLCALLAAHRAGRSCRPALYWTLTAALVLLATGTRETSLASFGVVAVWYVLGSPLPRRTMAVYLGMLLAGAAPLLIGRILLRRFIAHGSYTSGYRFTWPNISGNILMWSYYLVRDFPALGLFLIAAVILAWRKVRAAARLHSPAPGPRPPAPLTPAPGPRPLAPLLAWMACCVAIYLPWQYLSLYYLLPFSAAASVFCGLVAGELRAPGRRWTRAVLASAAALLLIQIVNGVNAARYQVKIDEANAALLESLRQFPPASTVLMNVPFGHEYVYEIQMHLNHLLARPDLRFQPLDFSPLPAGPAYVVSMQVRHELWPLLRGPMLETSVAQWNQSWKAAFPAAAPLRETVRAWQLADIGLQSLWCAAGDRVKPLSFAVMCHTSERPPIDLRTTSYGWTIDPYPRWKTDPVRVATFANGVWTIGESTLALGLPGDLPVAADWDGGGQLEPGVYRPSTNHWLIGRQPGGKPRLDVTLPAMQPGDLPVAADWTGARQASPGFYRPSDGTWHIGAMPAIHLGDAAAIPLAGDWDGAGRATPGVYWPASGAVILIDALRDDAPRVQYTLPAGAPVVVNWTGVGVDTVNTVKDGKWSRRFANCQCEPSNPLAEFAGKASDGQVFAGRWRR